MDEDKNAKNTDKEILLEEDDFVFDDSIEEEIKLREKEKLKLFLKKRGSAVITTLLIIALLFGNISGSKYKEIAKVSLADGLRNYVGTLKEMNLEYARTLNQDEFTYNKDKTQKLVEYSIDMLSMLRDRRKILILTYEEQDGIESVREMAARLRNFSSDGKYTDYEKEYIKKDYEYTSIMLKIIKETIIENGIESGVLEYNFSEKANINKVVTAICKKSAEVVHSDEYKIVSSYDWNPNESIEVNYTRDEAFKLSKEIMDKILPDTAFEKGEERDPNSRDYYFNRTDVDIFKPTPEDLNNRNTKYACSFDKETGEIWIHSTGWISSNGRWDFDYQAVAEDFKNKLITESVDDYYLYRAESKGNSKTPIYMKFHYYKEKNGVLYENDEIIISIADTGKLEGIWMNAVNDEEPMEMYSPVVSEKEVLEKIQIGGEVEDIKLIYMKNKKLIYRVKQINNGVVLNIDYDTMTGKLLAINMEEE